jgi:hypothetical protein
MHLCLHGHRFAEVRRDRQTVNRPVLHRCGDCAEPQVARHFQRDRATKPGGDARVALQQLDPLWDQLFPAEQARIVGLLVERVDLGMDGMKLRLRLDGLSGLAREVRCDEMEHAA